MANEPVKPNAPAIPANLTAQQLIEILQQQNKTLVEALSAMGTNIKEGVSQGLSQGLTMAEMARSKAQEDLLDTSRKQLKALGAPCPKCRMPINVCGGPEYEQEKDKDGQPVFQLDAEGKQVLKNGKPVPVYSNVMVKGEDKNHAMLVVMPQSPYARRWFSHRGIHINGVHFQSNHAQHRIPVPRNNDIAGMLQSYEQVEEEARQGRVREWNSGHMERGVTTPAGAMGAGWSNQYHGRA